MSGRGAYNLLGYFLVPAGSVLGIFSYFVLNSPQLTALGISLVMLGVTCVALAWAVPHVSTEASLAFFQTAMENTAALIEELGLTAKAIYIPASLREGKPQAIIPLLPNVVPKLDRKLPGRLIVRYGPNPPDMAIAVTTLGSVGLANLETKPGISAMEIEDALSHILVGGLDLATSVRVIIDDKRVEIEMTGPKLRYDNIWFYQCLGSPLASIAATVTAEALDKPVLIKSETQQKDKSRIEIEVLG